MLIISPFCSPGQVLRDFYNVRIQYYDRRKVHLIDKLTEDWEKLDNKVSNNILMIKNYY